LVNDPTPVSAPHGPVSDQFVTVSVVPSAEKVPVAVTLLPFVLSV
jgi:hypothetical protein